MSSEVNKALQNLAAIKEGEDPRPTEPSPTLDSDDALEVADAEVDRLYDKHAVLRDNLPRSNLHVGVSRNDGRNGVCKFNRRLTKRRFNKQITQTERRVGHHAVVINEKILEQGNRDEFIDTVRHEVAHALACAMYEKYPSRRKHVDYDPQLSGHGPAWKDLASALGADPSSCHSRRDRSDEYKYYLGCPNCGAEWGKTKRSKVIKRPFHRKCQCGQTPLCSYDAGDDMPEPGVVAVESIPWDDKDGWLREGRP